MKAEDIARGPQNQPPQPVEPMRQPETLESLVPKTKIGWVLTLGAAAVAYSFAKAVMNGIKRE